MSMLLRRVGCAVCGNRHLASLLDVAYRSAPLAKYLDSYYAERGGQVDWAPLSGERYVVDRCVQCGLLSQRFVPDAEVSQDLYEQWIDPEWSWAYERDRNLDQLVLQVMQMLVLLGQSAHDVTALDYGMGWGTWCRIAMAVGCDVVGCELSDTRVRRGRELGVRVVDLAEINDGELDFVNAEQVFEHLVDPVQTLATLVPLVRPGGLIRVSVPTSVGVERAIQRADWTAPKGSRWSMHALHPLEHINCFTQSAIEMLGARVGLTTVEVPWSHHLRFAPWWRGARGARHAIGSAHRAARRQSSVGWFRVSTRQRSPVT